MKAPAETGAATGPASPRVESALERVMWQGVICVAALVCGCGITLVLDGGPKVPGMVLAVAGILLLPAGAALCERLAPRHPSTDDRSA